MYEDAHLEYEYEARFDVDPFEYDRYDEFDDLELIECEECGEEFPDWNALDNHADECEILV